MNIKVKETGNVKVIELNGEIDGKSAPAVQEQIMPLVKSGSPLILDMGGVSFMSSAGLRVLLSLRRQLPGGSKLVLVGLSEQIQDTMAITGFLDIFTIAPTVAAGLTLLG